MKSFADWTSDLAAANNAPAPQPGMPTTWTHWILLGAADVIGPDGQVGAVCQGCGEWTEVECDPSEFDPTYHYCARSSRCCP